MRSPIDGIPLGPLFGQFAAQEFLTAIDIVLQNRAGKWLQAPINIVNVLGDIEMAHLRKKKTTALINIIWIDHKVVKWSATSHLQRSHIPLN